MKFGQQFEFHKIPEWYTEYLDYLKLKATCKDFKQKTKHGKVQKLKGLYYLTQKGCVIPMNIFTEGLAQHGVKKKNQLRNPDAQIIDRTSIDDQHVDHILQSNRNSNGFQDSDLESMHNHINTNLNQTTNTNPRISNNFNFHNNPDQKQPKNTLTRLIDGERPEIKIINHPDLELSNERLARQTAVQQDDNCCEQMHSSNNIQQQNTIHQGMTKQDLREQQLLKKEIEYVLKNDGKPRRKSLFAKNDIMDSMIGGFTLPNEDEEIAESPRFLDKTSHTVKHKKNISKQTSLEPQNSKYMIDGKFEPLNHISDKTLDEFRQGLTIDIPHFDRSKIQYLIVNEDEDDQEKIQEAEKEMREWIKSFMQEVKRIEAFYLKQCEVYKNEFDTLNLRYIQKVQGINDADQNSMSVINEHSFDDTLHRKQNSISQNISKSPALLLDKEEKYDSNNYSTNNSPLLGVPKDRREPRLSASNFSQSRQHKLNRIKTVEAKKLHKVKDELEYATNWRRAFSKVFQHIKWLNAFAKINYIASLKMINKMMKSFFVLEDNIVDKKLMAFLNSMQFARRRQSNILSKEIMISFSKHFTDDNMDKAQKALESHHSSIRKKDAVLMSFFVGLLSMIGFVTLVLLIVPDSSNYIFDQPKADQEIYASFYTFRFLFMILFTLLSTGVVISILKTYKINYLFIFELDPHYKVTPMQLFRVSLMLLTILAFFFMGQIFIIKLDYLFEPIAIMSLIVLVIFILLCFQPFHFFYQRARLDLLIVLVHIFISPFGIVRFKHFFLADILTSFVNPFKDLGYMGCFYFNGLWKNSDLPGADLCPNVENYTLIIAFLPYWFRLAQCMRRYHDTKLKAHLINGGKYFSSILIQLANVFKTKDKNDTTFWIFVAVSIYSTLYSYSWDLYMDWGLLRSKEPGKKYLRNKLLYPAWFYYYAVVSNFIMRFFWVISLPIYAKWVGQSQLITLIQSVVEGFRRAQWSLIRIENENVNNFERYRNILQIPAFKDDEDIDEHANDKK
eukprot:403367865